jgi:hypothetical protein
MLVSLRVLYKTGKNKRGASRSELGKVVFLPQGTFFNHHETLDLLLPKYRVNRRVLPKSLIEILFQLSSFCSRQLLTPSVWSELPTNDATQHLFPHPVVDMESPRLDTSATHTPSTSKSKPGKLKTYTKQRVSSASKPMRASARIRAASEENTEPSIPPTIDDTPVQPKADRKASKKARKAKRDAVASPVDEAMPDADAAVDEPAKTRKRRSKKKSLPETRLEQDQEPEQEVQVPETQPQLDDYKLPTQSQDQLDQVAESESQVDAGAVNADLEEPTDFTEGDISQFDLPPNSENEAKQEQGEPQAAPAKTRSKRKRQSAEDASPPVSSNKRIKRASIIGDYPKEGPFTPVECDMIENHLMGFIAASNLTREQLVALIQSSSRDMSKIYVELATDVLPHRNRRAVQRYCRRHYNNFQRGRWNDEQDDLLRTAYAESPNRWVKIGERVGRMPEDCRDRWRNHVSLDQRHTDVWTQDEEQRLATAVRECLRAMEGKLEVALTRENEDDYIAWPVVVKKMNGSRNRLQCSMKWRKIKERVAREEASQRAREEAIERGEIAANQDHDDGMTSPHTTTRWKAEAKRRFDEMSVGDMLDITRETLYGAQMGAFASKNTFWAVVTRLHGGSPWTTADRKLVYKRLKANIVDQNDFKANLEEQVRWLLSSFDEEALAERTIPKNNRPIKRSSGTFRSEEKVREDSDEEDLTMPSMGVEQQLDAELADAVGGYEGVARLANAHVNIDPDLDPGLDVDMNGLGNGNGYGYTVDQELAPHSPHISESEHENEEGGYQ